MATYAGVINFGGVQYKPDPFPQNAPPAYVGNFTYQAPLIVLGVVSRRTVTPRTGSRGIF